MFSDMFGLVYGDPFSEHRDGVVVLLAFTCAGLTYGALHLLAWNSPFTSVAQKMLWRISAVAIAVLYRWHIYRSVSFSNPGGRIISHI